MNESLKIITHICQQKESSITVLTMSGLLTKANIPRIQMGYDSWGNVSITEVLFVFENKGYIVKRKEKNKDSSVIILLTKNGKKTECGKLLTNHESKAFKKLGLNCSSSDQSFL